jgi:L-histidine Nalpha-methyltransferase
VVLITPIASVPMIEPLAPSRTAPDCESQASVTPIASGHPPEGQPLTPGGSDRLTVHYLSDPEGQQHQDDGQDVVQGLSQRPRSLPCRYFYDRRGSELFEQICQLPEYYPTRTEAWILQQYAPDIGRLTGPCELVELGSGSSTKTRQLLDAYQTLGHPLRYVPIDVSDTMITASAQKLLQDYPNLQVSALVGTYDQALAHWPATPCPGRLLFFLGSSLGNFTGSECDRLMQQVLAALQPGEYFLLGLDLQKSKALVEPAYDDSQGITAAFNLNILDHLNWRYGGNFQRDYFTYWSFYNEQLHQIESYLRCTRSHQVQLTDLGLNLEFEAGETIHTEISRKYDLGQMCSYLGHWGLSPLETWTDPQGWFGLVLCQAQP